MTQSLVIRIPQLSLKLFVAQPGEEEFKHFDFVNIENERDSNTVNIKKEERNFDIIQKGHGENKQPAAGSFMNESCSNSADLESQAG